MKRNSNIDLLKTISILLVIVIHALPMDVQMVLGRPFTMQHAVPVFMILFGYNRVKSIEKRNLTGASDLYEWTYLWKQLKAILVPYTAIWVIFEFTYFGLGQGTVPLDLFESFVVGGRGPGGYFILLMVQAILFFPILFQIMDRFQPVKALTGIFLVNILLEMMSVNMHPDMYRLLITRHIFTIALGIYLAKREDSIKIKNWLPLVGVSLIYISIVDYGGVHFIIEHMWDSQHPPAYFWTFLLVYLGLKVSFKEVSIVTFIGKSSYHIFLVQKIYFMFRNLFFSSIPYGLDVVVSLIISVTLGIAFYMICKNYNSYFNNRRDYVFEMDKYREKR